MSTRSRAHPWWREVAQQMHDDESSTIFEALVDQAEREQDYMIRRAAWYLDHEDMGPVPTMDPPTTVIEAGPSTELAYTLRGVFWD